MTGHAPAGAGGTARRGGPSPTGARWTSQVGAWLAIGTSPGALVFGAGLAIRADGPVPVAGLLLGAALAAVLLYAQGLVGLVPPTGEDGSLSEIAPRYLGPRTFVAVNVALAAAMIGWFGFGVGLGGAALSTVLGIAPAVGPLLIAVPVAVLVARGQSRWNWLAIVTTTSALALVAVAAVRGSSGASPVAVVGGTPASWLGDAGVIVGWVAVFSFRAPDFSRGLASRAQLRRCVAALVVTTVLVATAGASLALATGQVDVVASLSTGGDATLGNVLVAVAVIGALFGNLHSGSLAVRTFAPVARSVAIVLLVVPGTLLAIVRFDRHLVPFLEVLAIALPPLLVPMAVEAARRRRGRAPRRVRTVTWLPGAAAGAVGAAVGAPVAPVLGLGVAVVATTIDLVVRRDPV